MTACNGDRLLNLCMHRLRLMGAEQRRFYEKFLRPGSTVVDIGANQGLYSLLFSRLVGPAGCVFSFEPDPGLFKALQINCDRNGAANVRRFNCALGAQAETRTLYHSRVNSGDNRLAEGARPDWFYEVPIRMETLDSSLGNMHIDFIKLDVQGWEFEVVKGMTQTWQNNPTLSVYFEFWPFGLQRAGCEPVALLEHFAQHGFEVHDCVGADLRPVADYPGFCSRFQGFQSTTNLLALRPACHHTSATASATRR